MTIYSPTNRMTGGSLPAQTWHDIMVAAHQGVEIKEIPGIGAGTKLPALRPLSAAAKAKQAPKPPDIKPGTAAGPDQARADILVRVEKLLDEAAKTAAKTSSGDPQSPSSRYRPAPLHSRIASRRQRQATQPLPRRRARINPCG
jgi:penicillin-binding protein 1A